MKNDRERENDVLILNPNKSTWLLSITKMNNRYRWIMVVALVFVRLKHHSALVIIIVGVNIRGLSYTKTRKRKFHNNEVFLVSEQEATQQKKRNRMKERITTAYPRSAVMSFGYICVKRERMSLSRVLFSSLSLFFSFLSFPSIYQKVCFDGRVFFPPSFSLACIVFFFVRRARQRR